MLKILFCLVAENVYGADCFFGYQPEWAFWYNEQWQLGHKFACFCLLYNYSKTDYLNYVTSRSNWLYYGMSHKVYVCNAYLQFWWRFYLAFYFKTSYFGSPILNGNVVSYFVSPILKMECGVIFCVSHSVISGENNANKYTTYANTVLLLRYHYRYIGIIVGNISGVPKM